MTFTLLQGTHKILLIVVETVASAAAIVSPIFLIVVVLSTYVEESGALSDLFLVFSLAAVGYLSPKIVLRCLAVVVALSSLCEIWSIYRHYLNR